jgi:type IV secretion system protein VirB9
MMRAVLLATCMMLTTPALALDLPEPGRLDQNTRIVDYVPGQRWKVVGDLHRITNFTFGENERIARVAFGEDGLWSGPKPDAVKDSPLRNSIPLQPVSTKPTNMVVYTWLPDGRERIYPFDLSANDDPMGAPDPAATYGLIFTYSAMDRKERNKEAASIQREQAAVRDENVAKARQDVSVFYSKDGKTNWQYALLGDRQKGDFSIGPTEISDNTQSTRFRFPGNAPIPAIFKIGPDGNPQTVNPLTIDDLRVVYDRARVFLMRQGGRVLGVLNCDGLTKSACTSGASDLVAFSAIPFPNAGFNPGTGTTSPDVIRTIRANK